MSSRRRKKSFKRIFRHKLFRTRNIFSLICILFTFAFLIFLIKTKILPYKYNICFIIILFIICLISIILINAHKKIVLRILGYILMSLCILFDFIGFYYVVNVDSFIDKKFHEENSYYKTNYYIIARKDKNYDEKDIKGSIGVYQESVYLDDAINRLQSKFSIKEVKIDDLNKLMDSLNNGLVNFALIDRTTYELLFVLSDSYSKVDYSVLYDLDLYTKKGKKKKALTNVYNIFIGLKDYYGVMDYSMILTLNMEKKEMLYTIVPSNYYFSVSNKMLKKDSFKYMDLDGENALISSLEDLLEINIDYSIIIDSNQLVPIINYFNGIKFCSDFQYTTTKNSFDTDSKTYMVKKGCERIYGKEALAIIREKDVYSNSEVIRYLNYKEITRGIVKSLFKKKSLLHLNETMNLFNNLYDTDISKNVVLSFISEFISDSKNYISSYQLLTGNIGIDKVRFSNLYELVTYPDSNSIKDCVKSIKETMN